MRTARLLLFAAQLALLLVTQTACQTYRWSVGPNVRAPEADVAVALGDTRADLDAGIAASDIPEITYPQSLRPCCVFGANVRVEVGRVPVPGMEIGNLIDASQVGPHRYDNGYLSLHSSDPRAFIGNEKNGLVYTCRGGFIDLAHVRDNADNTLALAAAIARALETGGSLDLPPQGAKMRVRWRPVPADAISKYGRGELSVALAQWLAYQLSIWHEIATFYGYASLANWPEKISAFSPEDLYSNQIGVRLAGGIALAKQARSDVEYAVSMDAWIQRMLERLEAVPLAESYTAMQAVDGAWWDSSKRVPDWTLVKRRHFDAGPLLAGWRLEEATPGTGGAVQVLERCRDAAPPLVLDVVDGFAGARFLDYGTVEFEVDEALVEAGLPLPRIASRLVTQQDFPTIIDAIRQANAETFGPGADAP